jgi:5-dehydro-2-deoxygluconokinase
MTAAGFDDRLYILSMDQDGSSRPELLGRLRRENTARTSSAERVIYEGFQAAIKAGVPKAKAGIFASEECGAAIVRDAAMQGYLAVHSAGNMGHEEFEFEHEKFKGKIETLQPALCSVRVRYHPRGVKTLNRRQAARLRRLSEYLRRDTQSLFLCELLPPAPPTLLHRLSGDRASAIVRTIEELQNARIEPDSWGIEALDRVKDYEQVVAAAHRGGRKRAGCVVISGGEDPLSVRRWLATAAAVDGFVGFVVGAACFEDPLLAWRQGKIARSEAADLIGYRYRRFVEIFEQRLQLAA